HDGTQQRLVSLAMNLGMARAQASTPEEAQQAIAEAHEEAKAALAELRNLIRGLHPAVLEDRGLDAALSGVTARMPIPVRLTVDMPRRPAPVIEAVAYFVVSEGLANIVKHAQASQAEVIVQQAGDRLHIIVSDDGAGGADPARGTGLAGLARRAASVDPTFDVSRPHPAPGGPAVRQVTAPGRRVWGASGLATVLVLAVPGTWLITRAGMSAGEQLSVVPTRTVVVTQQVTSLDVRSYGAPVRVTAGPGTHVKVIEAITVNPHN